MKEYRVMLERSICLLAAALPLTETRVALLWRRSQSEIDAHTGRCGMIKSVETAVLRPAYTMAQAPLSQNRISAAAQLLGLAQGPLILLMLMFHPCPRWPDRLLPLCSSSMQHLQDEVLNGVSEVLVALLQCLISLNE